ncbi:hypothetical protein [Oceanobacillus profundus]|uniref:hypothetical protein n=1 Tax=Oceanobacillus TaxID=182709 RepID=UPI0026E3F604|nr:hypothetical protein [Oceanobacillus profundus]MDO6450621.1 hypothetical protein [Oceanobacillus profundus]
MSEQLATGALRNGQIFYARYLRIGDLARILELQKKVVNALPHPDVLEPLTTEEFTNILEDKQMMIGIFVENNLIAFRAMLAPENDDEGLGADIGLEQTEFHRILYSEISNVDPRFRGNGLQTYMGKLLLRNVDRNRYRYLLSTVAPFNFPSLKDKFSLGMKIAVLKDKYNGKLRYVFRKDLASSETELQSEEWIEVRMDDIAKQQDVLALGFYGVSMRMDGEEVYVRFEK